MRLGKWLAFIGAVGVGSIAALASQGCTITSGAVDLDGGFTDTDANPPPTTTPACNACLFAGCSNYYYACKSNTECDAIYQCLLGCADLTCQRQCVPSHPTGEAAYRALSSCDQAFACTSCGAECPSFVTEPCPTPPPPVDAGADTETDSAPQPVPDAAVAPQTCDDCVAASCAAEKQACAKGTECDVYTQCVFACNDSACSDKCDADHAAGKAAGIALGSCTVSKCATACSQ